MLRWLLLIPFACLVAMGAGLFAFVIAGLFSPDLALAAGGGFARLLDGLFGAADAGIDPEPMLAASFGLIARLGFAIVVAPVLAVAAASELFRLRSGLVQSGLAGLLAVVLPLAMLGLTRVPNGAEVRVLAALYLIGAFAGFVYWLIAGRDAGEGGPRPGAAPR